jgi:uncharacterized protein (TIRG00374 family)
MMIEFDETQALVRKCQKEILILAPILLLAALLFAAIRWHNLLASLNIFKRTKELYGYYLIGLFYNIFLPGVIGGDIVRIALCARDTERSVGIITVSVFIERVCGLVVLLIVGSIAILCLPSEILASLGKPVVQATVIFTTLCVTLIVLLFVIGRGFHGKYFLENHRTGTVNKFVKILNLVIKLPFATLFSLVAFSALYQTLTIVASYAIVKALGISVPLTLFFALMPMVYICTVLPISLGGLGVREGTLVFLLAKVGILKSDAIALSFLIFFNTVMVASMGLILQVFWRKALLSPFKPKKQPLI